MPRRSRRFRLLFQLGVLLAIGTACVFYVRSSLLLRHLRPIVVRYLSERTGATLRVGQLGGTLFGHIVARNVTLTVDDSQPPMLWADRLEVAFRPGSLLRRALDVESVRVSGLELHVRRRRGHPFDVQTVVENLLREAAPSEKPSTFTVRLRDLEIVADRVVVDDGESAVLLNLKGARFVSRPTASLDLALSRPLSFDADGGTLALGELRQAFSQTHLRGYLSPQRVVLDDMRLRQRDSRFALKGVVSLAPAMRVDLRGDASVRLRDVRGLNPSALNGADGVASFVDARIAGDPANPSLRANVVVDGFRHPAIRLDRTTAQVAGNLRTLTVAPIRTHYLDAAVEASATLTFGESGGILLRANAEGFHLRAVRETYLAGHAALEPLDGAFDGSVTVSFEGSDFESSGVWTPRRVAWRGQPVAVGTLRHTVEKGVVRAEGVVAGIAVDATGRIPQSDEPLNFRVVATGGNVTLAASLAGFKATGAVSAEATVTGGPQNPTIAFGVRLVNGTVNDGYPVPSLDVRGDWNAERVHLSEARLVSGDGYARATGDIRLLPNAAPQLDIGLHAERFDIAPYVQAMAKNVPFAGRLDGAVNLRGALDSLDVSGELRPHDVRLDDVPLILETVPVRAEDGRFELPRLAASIGAVRASGHASFDKEGYAFKVGLDEPAAVASLRANLPERLVKALADLNGVVELDAWGADRYDSPSASLTLSLDGARYRNVALGRSVADVLFDERAVRGRGTLVDRNFEFDFGVDLAEASLPLTANVSCFESDILPLIRIAGQPAGKGMQSALLTGSVDVSGDLARLESLVGNVVLDTVRLSTVRHTLENTQPVRGTVTTSGVQFDRLTMASANPEHPFDILAEGLLDWRRPVDLNVDARVFDLATVADFLGLPDRFYGSGTYRLRVRGTTKEPEIQTAWQMHDATFDIAPDRPPLVVRDVVGAASYRDKALRLERVAFRLGQEPVVVTGEIPFDLSFVLIPVVERVVDAPLNVTVANRDPGLSWLAQLDNRLMELSGATELDIRLSGTVDKPVVEGAVSINVFRALVGSLKTPLTNVTARVRLDTPTEPDGTRTVRARLEGGGTLSSSAATWDGVVTFPIPSDYLTKGFRADDLRGELSTRVEGASLSSFVDATGGGALPIDVVASGGAAWMVRGSDPKAWRGTLVFDRVALTGNGRTLANGSPVTATYADNVLRVGDFVLRDEAGRVDVQGSFRFPNAAFDLSVRSENVDLALLGGFVAPHPLEGRLDATLTASGTPDAPRFSMEWQARGARLERVVVDSFRGGVAYDGGALALRDWDLFSYGNHLTVNGRVPVDIGLRSDAPSVRAVEAPMSVALRADGIRLDFAPLVLPAVSEAAGVADVDLTVAGTLGKPTLRGRATVTDGRFRFAGSGTELADVAVALNADDAAIRAEEARFRVGDGLYVARGTLLTMEGLSPVALRSAVDFTNASVESWLKPPQAFTTALSGTGAFAVDLAGMRAASTTDDPQRDMSTPAERALRLGSFVDGAVVIESAGVNVAKYRLGNGDPLVARLRKGTLEFGSLTGDAWRSLRDATDAPWSETIFGPALTPAAIRHDVTADMSRFLAVDAKGTWNLTRALDVNVAGTVGTQLLNELIAERLPRPPDAPVPTLSGRFRFDGRLSGTAKNPRLTLSASADNLQVNSVAVQGLSTLITYADETLNIEGGRFLISGNEVRVGGEIPFAFDPLAGRVGALDRDFAILVDSSLRNFDFLPAMFPAVIERAEGIGTVHLTLGGRLQSPLYQGSIQAQNLLVDVPANHILLSETNAYLTLTGDTLRVEPSRPIVGRLNDGVFRVTDAVIRLEKGLPTSADVRGTLDDVTFYEPGEYRVKTDATLRAFGPLDHLRVSGEILPSEIRYEQDWKQFVRDNLSSKAQIRRRAQFNLPLLRGIEFDVSVQADRDIVVDTGVGELEARVNGRVVGLVTSPIFVGEVSVPKGEFSYLGNRFSIESGQITNTDAGRFDPEYTIVASTVEPLRSVRLLDEQGRVQVRDARVQATLRGRLEQAQPPEFAVTVLNRAQGEEFSLTTQQGISLLTFGDATLIAQGSDSGLTSATGNLLKEGAQSYIGGRFARALGLRTLNVDVFANDIETSRFSLTKELSSQWVITYASTLHLDQEQRLEVEYLVNRNLSIIGERNEQGRYGVDLKFEYDFR